MPLVSKKNLRIIWSITLLSELLYWLPDRQGLSSKLAIKWANCSLIRLEGCSSSPNRPIMKISSSLESIVSYSINRWRWNISYVWIFNFHYPSNKFLKQCFIIIHIFARSPSPILYSLQNLIISTPNSQCRIVSGSSYLLFNLLLNIL